MPSWLSAFTAEILGSCWNNSTAQAKSFKKTVVEIWEDGCGKDQIKSQKHCQFTLIRRIFIPERNSLWPWAILGNSPNGKEKPRNNFFGDHIAPIYHASIFSIEARHLGGICIAGRSWMLCSLRKHVKGWCANRWEHREDICSAAKETCCWVWPRTCAQPCASLQTLMPNEDRVDAEMLPYMAGSYQSQSSAQKMICSWVQVWCRFCASGLTSSTPFLRDYRHVLPVWNSPHFGGTEDAVHPQSKSSIFLHIKSLGQIRQMLQSATCNRSEVSKGSD